MNGYLKYFDNRKKNMFFLIKNNEVWEKYEDIWNVIKNKRSIKFNSEPVYENKYLKAKVREFNGDGLPKENMYYTCIACITIDSVLRMNKTNYQEVYLEEHKYKIKKIHTLRFINTELETDSESDVETDSESNTTTEH